MNEPAGNRARRYGVVVVAAGRGERAGVSGGPKQYRHIGDRPVVVHTLETFLSHPLIEEIVLVTHNDDDAYSDAALSMLGDPPAVLRVHGGRTRQQSVLNGLRALARSGVNRVLIHDAVRPFVRASLIDRIDDAFADGALAVLPAVAISDTLKQGNESGNVEGTVPRSGLFGAQTPQAFVLADILAAHEAAAASGRDDFTDDAAIAERAGISVRLIAGDPDNTKLTLASDIEMADRKLGGGLPDVRTGNGYDVHRLVPGSGVTLCGIRLPHDQALDGHSDADVALHALTDALLATCGAGDIGDHFPPSDPRWKGVASATFVKRAVEIVKEAGGTIMNADISIIAEAPRIGPRRAEMRAALASMLGIAIERCSVKATTNETIGFIGRREGIAAIATATVVYGRHQQ